MNVCGREHCVEEGGEQLGGRIGGCCGRYSDGGQAAAMEFMIEGRRRATCDDAQAVQIGSIGEPARGGLSDRPLFDAANDGERPGNGLDGWRFADGDSGSFKRSQHVLPDLRKR
ncbi:Uncharacterised protein [Mycobacteroides abscessus subsp. abscessus]|nr:Uncharacterised protein [Mycobacteroides abscessus subsp. abscessus]